MDQEPSDQAPCTGPYRVRAHVEREQSVPQQVQAARFASRDAAEAFALLTSRQLQQTLVVEKLAPAGCWLQLSTVAASR
ncbi:hypothetical protein KBY96_09885 [Cyanobium sp. ATX 6A2]|uniref:hypothetical protein n=1 Tax=Cyanobium sp. ATX 6A2 TaxID=2823700 RepID=UPI0020CEFDAE|nr:hypothetical protein [Cyanobium sp. ATX 6A2]MCP9888235.1 hypothetical protein [Cyanobium sp. ATX 6A2]